MIKNRLNDIRKKVLKRYVGVYCESVDENDAVKKIREILKLDDSWESSYKIEDFSNNITINFTNGENVIEIKFLSNVGNNSSYAISYNEKRVVTKDESNDVKNILDIIKKDSFFIKDLAKIELPEVEEETAENV